MTGHIKDNHTDSPSEFGERIFNDFITNKKSVEALLGEGSTDLTEPEIIEIFSDTYPKSQLVPNSDMVKRVQAWIKHQKPPEFGPSLASLECSFSRFVNSPVLARYLVSHRPTDVVTPEDLNFLSESFFSLPFSGLSLFLREKIEIYLNQPIEYTLTAYRSPQHYADDDGVESDYTFHFRSDAERECNRYAGHDDAQIIKIISGCGKDKAVFTQKDLPKPE